MSNIATSMGGGVEVEQTGLCMTKLNRYMLVSRRGNQPSGCGRIFTSTLAFLLGH